MQPAQEVQVILFSDIRGYSAFTTERVDEEAYRLSTAFFAFAREQVAGSNGRVVKTYGDGVTAVFSAPADGISGAIAVQKGLEARNRESHEMRVSAGVGITSGRVISTEGDAFGHAVNLAKRLSDQGMLAQARERLRAEADKHGGLAAAIIKGVEQQLSGTFESMLSSLAGMALDYGLENLEVGVEKDELALRPKGGREIRLGAKDVDIRRATEFVARLRERKSGRR